VGCDIGEINLVRSCKWGCLTMRRSTIDLLVK
jgi:hypothetical protein